MCRQQSACWRLIVRFPTLCSRELLEYFLIGFSLNYQVIKQIISVFSSILMIFMSSNMLNLVVLNSPDIGPLISIDHQMVQHDRGSFHTKDLETCGDILFVFVFL